MHRGLMRWLARRACMDDRPSYVALLTPGGRGAVATVCVEGPLAVSAVSHCFRPAMATKRLADFSLGRIVFGRWGDEYGEELVCICLESSRVELHCHGGEVAARRIIDDLTRQGCREVNWRQWAEEHEQTTIAVEALRALAEARTERAAAILLDQYQGALANELHRITQLLCESSTKLAAEGLQQLVARSPLGLHLANSWKVVLAGRPNVGKSSLINALLGYGRSIVFDQPGTTRDVVTATTSLDGWPVELVDTAGLRDSDDPLEAEGTRRAAQQMRAADCLLLVFDGSQPWSAEDVAIVEQWPTALIVHNKSDLTPAGGARPAGLLTSALADRGIDALTSAIATWLVPQVPSSGAAVPFTTRQVECLRKALDATAAEQQKLAQHFLDICCRQPNTLGSAAGHEHLSGMPR